MVQPTPDPERGAAVYAADRAHVQVDPVLAPLPLRHLREYQAQIPRVARLRHPEHVLVFSDLSPEGLAPEVRDQPRVVAVDADLMQHGAHAWTVSRCECLSRRCLGAARLLPGGFSGRPELSRR